MGYPKSYVWSNPFLFAIILTCVEMLGTGIAPVEARSLEEIKNTKEIRICLSPLHPVVATVEPPDCRENCEFGGVAYETSRAFAATLGTDIKLKFFHVDWDEQFFNERGVTVREESYTPELLASGKCDLYPSNLTKNSWRLKKIDFVTLFPSRMMIIVHRSKRDQFKSEEDLGGNVAGIVKDTSFHTWLQEQNKSVRSSNPIQIQAQYKNTIETLKALNEGKVDFTVLDSDMAIWSSRYQSKSIVVVFPVGPVDEIGWGFRKEDKDLQTAVGEFFDKQRALQVSEFNKIWKDLFGITLTQFISLLEFRQRYLM